MSLRKLAFLVLTIFSNTILPGLAADWFNKYDTNHDGHWDYAEFRKANNEYSRRHLDRNPLSDEELRAEFGRRADNPRGWVHETGVKDFQNW